jgi:hypothetical protein
VEAKMNLQRKLALMIATGAVALGAGHFVQEKADQRAESATAEPEAPPAPIVMSSVTTVAAGPGDAVMPMEDFARQPALPAEAAPMPVSTQMASVPAKTQDAAPPVVSAPVEMATSPALSELVQNRGYAEGAFDTQPKAATADCNVQLTLMAQPGAMIGLSLLAPCNPDERVVLKSAGLAVTGQTSASGALLASLPALTAVSEVTVAFGNGEQASSSIAVPDAISYRRFGVQWQDGDAFQLHAFENGATYNQPGDISSAFTGTPGQGGFLTLLGDANTKLPLLAEIYTFPRGKDAEIVLEAAVTSATCGREILGETVKAVEGTVEITDLSLAMPDCEGVGDILVLKNLMQDTKLAAAN